MRWRLLGAAIVVAATTWLGFWQLDRAREKSDLRQRLEQMRAAPALSIAPGKTDASGYHLRRVEAQGAFDPESTIYLDNKVRRGAVGYEIVTLLKMQGERAPLLVNRGWIAGGLRRDTLPHVPVPQGEVRIEGVAVGESERVLELSEDIVEDRVWQNLNPDRYEKRFGIAVQPFIVKQENDTGDGLARNWVPPDTGADKHRAYAVQWFALAALTLVFYLAVGRKK